jgi:WD40 repeat protein
MNPTTTTNSTPPNPTPADPQKTHAIGEFKYTSPLLSCRFDPSGQFVFATAYDNTIQRWQLSSGKATPLVGHDSWVRTLAFHPSGSTLYSGGYDGRVIWWEPSGESPQPQRTLEAHQGWVRTVTVSPDGQLLATCGNDNLVKLWNALDGTPLGECFGHSNHVYNVAFHPDGRRLVSGDLKGIVREWDLQSCEQLRQFDAQALWKYDPGFGADIGGVRGMGFSGDGKLLACGGISEVSNAFAGLVHPLVHRDGFLMGAIGGHDGGHLLFWKTEQPNEFFDFKLPDLCRDFDLHADHLRVATSHDDKTLRLWQMTAKAG